VVEAQLGADPYCWIEGDVRKDAAVAFWVAEHNEVATALLSTILGLSSATARQVPRAMKAVEAFWAAQQPGRG
jgi:hypothetical protein